MSDGKKSFSVCQEMLPLFRAVLKINYLQKTKPHTVNITFQHCKNAEDFVRIFQSHNIVLRDTQDYLRKTGIYELVKKLAG